MTTAQVGQDNIALVRRGYEAFAAGDMAALTELFHADAVWQAAPTGIFSGNYRGRDAIFAFFGRTQQEAAETFRATPVAMAASGERVFVLQENKGERKGRTLDASSVVVFTLVGGRVREVHEYFGDHQAEAAFWS